MSFKFDFKTINWSKNDPVSIVKAYREALQLQEHQRKKRQLATPSDSSDTNGYRSSDSIITLPLSSSESCGNNSNEERIDQSGSDISESRALVVVVPNEENRSEQIRKRRASSSSDQQSPVQAFAAHQFSASAARNPRSRLNKLQNSRMRKQNRPKFSAPRFWQGVRALAAPASQSDHYNDSVPSLPNIITCISQSESTSSEKEDAVVNGASETGPLVATESIRGPYVDSVTQTDNFTQNSKKRPVDISEIAAARKKRPGYFSANFEDSDSDGEVPVEEPVLKKRRLFTSEPPNTVAMRLFNSEGPSLSFSPRRTGDIAARREQLILREQEEEKKKREEEARQLELKKIEEAREKLEKERREFEEEKRRELEKLKQAQRDHERSKASAEAAAKAKESSVSLGVSFNSNSEKSDTSTTSTTSKPSFDFSSGSVEKTAPESSFNIPASLAQKVEMPKPTAPASGFSFSAGPSKLLQSGSRPEDTATKPASTQFSFGSIEAQDADKKTESEKASFSFGSIAPLSTSGNAAAASNGASTPIVGGFSFGSTPTTNNSKPSTHAPASSSLSTAPPSKPFLSASVTNGTSGKDEEKTPTTPTFSFGASASGASTLETASSSAAFSFGKPSTAPAAPFSFGVPSSGTTTPTSTSTSLPSFGSTSTVPAFGASTTAAPKFGAPSSSVPTFGSPSATAAPVFGSSTSTSATFGAAKPAASVFGPSTSSAPTFSAATSTAPTFGAHTSSAFGSTASASAAPAFGATAASTTGSTFASSSTPSFGASNSKTGFSFGATSSDPASVFGFGGNISSTPSPSTPVASKPPSFNFGSTSSAAPSAIFNFGGPSTPAANPGTPNGTASTDANNGNMFLAAAPTGATPTGRKLATMRSRRAPRR
ncbi:uncharacterized protein V2V93DRAFT_377611 [Kockiozyma suomiensis]|uniref:uncharacterized protein n=1 Tax=Kockiozyma suomiensis TaxID=1337062 RepID=UPI0033431A33